MSKSINSNEKSYLIDAFFAGVGGIELGFEQTGKFKVVYANEFDKNARITYKLNNPNTFMDERDIHDVSPNEIPDCDVIMGGFPCQAFSIAGYRKGFEDDRGDLFFELLKMIAVKKPKAIFIENVKNMVTHDNGNTFKVIREALVLNGYFIKWKVLNSKDYGNIPQNRERIYIVGFRDKQKFEAFDFPDKCQLTRTIRQIIDFSEKKDEIFYYREGKQPFYDKLVPEIVSQDTVYQWRRQYVRSNKGGVIPTLTANMGTGGHNVPLILTDTNEIRKMTPREVFNAQGYPKDFKLPDIANGQLYKQAGNSVVVPVIKRIAYNIAGVLSEYSNFDDEKDSVSAKYVLTLVDINGCFEGSTQILMKSDNKKELLEFIKKNNRELLNDEEYLEVIRKKNKERFYMILED